MSEVYKLVQLKSLKNLAIKDNPVTKNAGTYRIEV